MKTTRRGFFGFIGVTPLVSGVFAYRDAEVSATIEAKDGEWFHESLNDIIYDVKPHETPFGTVTIGTGGAGGPAKPA